MPPLVWLSCSLGDGNVLKISSNWWRRQAQHKHELGRSHQASYRYRPYHALLRNLVTGGSVNPETTAAKSKCEQQGRGHKHTAVCLYLSASMVDDEATLT